MIWRDANKKPRVSGSYTCLVEMANNPMLANLDFNLDGGMWALGHEILAWLDPEIPEKYLPEELWESPQTEVEQQAKELKEALEMRELIEGKRVERLEGEWVPFANFKFDRSKYYWAKDDGYSWIVDGCRCISPNIDLGSKAQIWSIPIEEPPR